MKAIILSLSLLTFVFSHAQETHFSLKVCFKPLTLSKRLLIYMSDDMRVDTLPYPINDTLYYKGTIKKSGEFQIATDSAASVPVWVDSIPLSFCLTEEKSKMGRNRFSVSSLVGSEDSKLYFEMTQPRNHPMIKIYPTDGKLKRDSVSGMFSKFYSDIIDSLFFVRATSPVLPYYIRLYANILGPETTRLFYLRLNNELQNSSQGKKIKEYLERSEILQKGVVINNFSMRRPNGKKLSLHSVQAKFILLEFWASWCVPCRAENPHLVKLYNKYKEKGFEIIAISLDDNKKEWFEAIQKDNLQWLHISDLNGWDNELAQKFKISSVPYTVLIDSNYKVISSWLSVSQLNGFLADSLK